MATIEKRARNRLYYGWVIVGVTFLTLLTAAGIRSTPGVLIVPLEREFGWTRAAISVAVSINLLLYGFSGPFAATLMDRFGVRRVMVGSLTLVAAGVGLTTLMHSAWQLDLLWGIVVGLGTGTTALVLGAYVANRWFVARRGVVMGILTASTATGQLLFLPFLASLVVSHGWRAAALTVTGAAVLIMPLVAVFMRNDPKDIGLRPLGAPEDSVAPPIPLTNPASAAVSALSTGLRSRDFLLLLGSFYICGCRPALPHRRGAGDPDRQGRSRRPPAVGPRRAPGADLGVLGRFLPVASAALIGLAMVPTIALAHAVLLNTDPPTLCSPPAMPRLSPDDPRCTSGIILNETPRYVSLVFNEPVELVGRGVRVFAPSGRRVDWGAARLTRNEVTMDIGGSESGTYLVLWRVVADDTHPSSGAFVFSVEHPSSPPGGVPRAADTRAQFLLGLALQAVGRALHFAGFALGFGTIVFRWAVLPPRALGEAAEDHLVWRLVNTGVLALVAAEPLALLAQASSLGEGVGGVLDPDVVSGALESSFGRILLQRLGAAGFLWILIGALQNAPSRAGPMSVAVALTGLALALVDGEAAHAGSTPVPWVGLGINALHVSAMGVWVGGLAALIGVWRLPALAGRRGEIAARARRLAVISLIILAGSGTLLAVQHLTGPRDLLLTAYGRTLAVKVGVFLAALLLAFMAARVAPVHGEQWWRREAAALLGILVLAGLLVSLRPPV